MKANIEIRLLPLLIIFAAVCLILAGCSNDEFVAPVDCGDDFPDEPVCSDSLPSVEILVPPADAPATYPTGVQFTWRTPDNGAIAGTRYLLTWVEQEVDAVARLNDNPEDFEDLWSEWMIVDREFYTLQFGEDDEYIGDGGFYLFAVQLTDSCGRVTTNFSHERNARQFRAHLRYPSLAVYEPMLGTASFWNIFYEQGPFFVPAGIPLTFMWEAPNTFDWLSPILYRCGWDIQNLDDDEQWSSPWSPFVKQSSERIFNSGVHVFYIEARDASGVVTHARIEIEIVPFQMERDLLWIDDYPLGGYIPSMTDPSEDVHDEFWTSLCSRVPGFDPATDIYEADVYNRGSRIPLSVFADYKNIVWTYSSAFDIAWSNSIDYDPGISFMFSPDNFRMFLAAGGNAITCGRADRPGGGLGEVFPQDVYYPASVTDELADMGYNPDHVKYALPHDYYFVTVLDKVSATFKSGEDMVPGVNRNLANDALRMAVEAENTSGLDFPDTLMLDETVSCATCFFNPQVRGFTYVEVYDPAYYMDHIHASSHPYFTPIYRMRSRSTISPLHNEAIALRVDSGSSPYDSYHFGFPLWFMEHEKVEQIMDEIFRSWEIR